MSLPTYSKGHCPDSLAWDDEFGSCRIRCIYPYYTEEELRSLLIVSQVIGIVAFLLCYFYCFTALFRPIMRKFPNSNIFFLHFSYMIVSFGVFFPLLLGERYVFCDTNTRLGKDNWACITTSVLYFYGVASGSCWFVCFHITTVARLYLISIPSVTPYVMFFLSFGTWSFVTTVIAGVLQYNTYSPGYVTCTPTGNRTFSQISQLPVYYLMTAITLVCVFLIIGRLFYMKKRTHATWKIIMLKQFRIFIYWIHFALYIIILTVIVFGKGRPSIDVFIDAHNEYRTCVLLAGDDEDCSLDVPVPHFSVLMLFVIVAYTFPITTFLVFGFRKDVFLFWKEYFAFCWKHKTLVLEFSASFDPSPSAVSMVQDLDDIEKRRSRLQRRLTEV